jgi:hypothetical protein
MTRSKQRLDDTSPGISESSMPRTGNASKSGTGTHATHRVEAEERATDKREKGTEGMREGSGKGYPRSGG